MSALLVGAVALAGLNQAAASELTSADRFSTLPVEIQLGGGYLVPRNYLHVLRKDRQDADTRAIIRVLWPNLEPLTLENAHHWQTREPERQIFIHLTARDVGGYDRLQNAIRYKLIDPTPIETDIGLQKLMGGTRGLFVRRRFVSLDPSYLTPDGDPLVFECNDGTQKAKENYEFESLCVVRYGLGDGSWLQYRFFATNLAQWRAIDSAVRQLIESFSKDKARSDSATR